MTLPISEQVAQALVTRLESVTTTAGYEVGIEAVSRPTTLGRNASPLDGEVVLIEQPADPVEQAAAYHHEWWQVYNAIVQYTGSDNDETSIEEHTRPYAAAIIKAVYSDVTFGGLALDAEAFDGGLYDNALGYTGRQITIRIHCRTLWGDPYSTS
jgi:hypothetical protein